MGESSKKIGRTADLFGVFERCDSAREVCDGMANTNIAGQ